MKKVVMVIFAAANITLPDSATGASHVVTTKATVTQPQPLSRLPSLVCLHFFEFLAFPDRVAVFSYQTLQIPIAVEKHILVLFASVLIGIVSRKSVPYLVGLDLVLGFFRDPVFQCL